MGNKNKPEQPVTPLGELDVSVRTARNLNQKVLVGKQSPFVQFELDDVKKKTACDKRGGRNPQWTDELVFNILTTQQNLMVKVYNRKSKVQADYIGETVIALSDIMEERERDSWFTIRNRGEFAGDVYIELTFHPHGVPRPVAPRQDTKVITEVEEGLSILSLKSLQNDPRLTTGELPTYPDTPVPAPVPKTAHLRGYPASSSASISSLGSNSESQFMPANENDLSSILDEIRSLVDYPYHVPAVEQPVGPGALPQMRRKPLPQPPSSKGTNSTSNSELNQYSSSPSNGIIIEGPFDSPRSKPIPPTPRHPAEFLHHPSSDYRSPSPAPSSAISDFALGDPVTRPYQYNNEPTPSGSSALGFPNSLTPRRRGSADSIAAFSTNTDPLDYDPASEVVEFSNNKTRSYRRRPMEAPSVLQSHEFTSDETYTPYAEDVRGRPVYYYPPESPQPSPQYSALPAGWVARPPPSGYPPNPYPSRYPVRPMGAPPHPPGRYPIPFPRPLPRPRGYVVPSEFHSPTTPRPPPFYPPHPQYPPRFRPERSPVPSYYPPPPARVSPYSNGVPPNYHSPSPLPPPKAGRPPSLAEY